MAAKPGKFKFPGYVPTEARACIDSWLNGPDGISGLVATQVADKALLIDLNRQLAFAAKGNDAALLARLTSDLADVKFCHDYHGRLEEKIKSLACENLMKDAYLSLSQEFGSNASQWSAYIDAAMSAAKHDFDHNRKMLLECQQLKAEVAQAARKLAQLLAKLNDLSDVGDGRLDASMSWPAQLIRPPNFWTRGWPEWWGWWLNLPIWR